MVIIVFFFVKVYPSLESDEEDHANKAKMKRKKNWDDTPWSPKGDWLLFYQNSSSFSVIFLMLKLMILLSSTARVMPTLPKQERPAREGARVASVETGLAAAAAKLAQQVSLRTMAMYYAPSE